MNSRPELWNQQSTILFFRQHLDQPLLIEDVSNRAKFCGIITEVTTLDLCSHLLEETTLKLETSDLQVEITFHDEFLGIHLLAYSPETQITSCSLPYQISYKMLKLTLLEQVS